MEELLKILDEKMKSLIDKYQRLKVSNLELNQNKFVMTREKDLLLIKQQNAVKQIEDLISKLKTIEKLS
jgi:uncharacterized protein (TIGR02449 family)